MATLKQYLENSWYRWASQDRQTWYAAQFQYWENINIRDMKNGVCLSWWATDVNTFDKPFSFFTHKLSLYTVDNLWVIRDDEWTQKCDLSFTSISVPQWVEFEDYIYVVSDKWVYRVTPWVTRTYDTVTPSDWWNPQVPPYPCIMNYANTFLLVWAWWKVWKYDKGASTAKLIREFESSYWVHWLTQEWNYLKIYTSNWIDTKIHYAKGTFDVEYTWLIQTVSFRWLSISTWSVASDQWQDYAAFIQADWEIKLSKISWYSKTDIRWTQTWDWQKIFTSAWAPHVIASDWVLFIAMDEWIWTFTEYNWWLWWWCVEFRESRRIDSMFRFWEKLYVCIRESNGTRIMRYYDLSFHPHTYQSSWFIIGRVFDGGCAWLFKKNDQATITYNMPVGTSMELSYRYDRETFGYDKSNFLTIKQLADTNTCYDIVVPTTPSKTEESNLLKEDWDLILLENWNWIKLEDTLVCPFNKTWNLLEYRFDFNTTDVSKTPILFEHSLTYYDYMRKYR